MSGSFKTEQEAFWAGEFGSEYSHRSVGRDLLAANCALFSTIISRTANVRSIIEFGANIGLSLRALATLLPEVELAAVEVNSAAAAALREWGRPQVFESSILEFTPCRTWDLVLTKGLLIHIDPAYLDTVYETLHESAARYLVIVEYYNPTPVAVTYHGSSGQLFKRDFAGEMLDRFPSLTL
ncbi:MAG TPA: pseudaminic acid biosynthesis-associated methylase, partial [Vicinamibacterales bacterium]